MSELVVAERPAAQDAAGLLVLHHGRGTSEQDLLPLASALDPQRRLHVAAPRAPLRLPGMPGYHWYRVPRVGYPEPESFFDSQRRLGELHQELLQRHGLAPQRLILGGFSMGAVMSYAVGLDASRPAPGGILALSGFIPTVAGFSPDLERTGVRVFITHGELDPVIGIGFAHRARDLLVGAGFPVEFRQFPGPHTIDPADLPRARAWIESVLSPTPQ